MRRSGIILAGALAVLLAGCLAALWLTRDAAPSRTPAQVSLVDRRLLDTARRMVEPWRDWRIADPIGGARPSKRFSRLPNSFDSPTVQD